MRWQDFLFGNPLCWLWIQNLDTKTEWLFVCSREIADSRVDALEVCEIPTRYTIVSLDGLNGVSGTTGARRRLRLGFLGDKL